MSRLAIVCAVLAATAAPALGQTLPAPVQPPAVPLAPAPMPAAPSPTGAPAAALPPPPAAAAAPVPAPAVKTPTDPNAPVINIDPRGFTGGTGAGAFSGLGTIIVDPLAGGAANAPVLPQTSAGADAAMRASTPTSLDPAPSTDAYPFCRNPNDQRCRARPGARIAQ